MLAGSSRCTKLALYLSHQFTDQARWKAWSALAGNRSIGCVRGNGPIERKRYRRGNVTSFHSEILVKHDITYVMMLGRMSLIYKVGAKMALFSEPYKFVSIQYDTQLWQHTFGAKQAPLCWRWNVPAAVRSYGVLNNAQT